MLPSKAEQTDGPKITPPPPLPSNVPLPYTTTLSKYETLPGVAGENVSFHIANVPAKEEKKSKDSIATSPKRRLRPHHSCCSNTKSMAGSSLERALRPTHVMKPILFFGKRNSNVSISPPRCFPPPILPIRS